MNLEMFKHKIDLEVINLTTPIYTIDRHINKIVNTVKVENIKKWPLPTPASSHCVTFYYKL